MKTNADLAAATLAIAYREVRGCIDPLSVDEALFIPPGCFRSSLGTLKHIAGWYHVYRAYAFDAEPRHWRQTDWPRGLRDTIEPSQSYWDELRDWFATAHAAWLRDLEGLDDAAMQAPRPIHWGATLPLFDIVAWMAVHLTFHAGEINQLQAIRKQEAWEDGEQVEENHISTIGHRVRPPWLPEGQSLPE